MYSIFQQKFLVISIKFEVDTTICCQAVAFLLLTRYVTLREDPFRQKAVWPTYLLSWIHLDDGGPAGVFRF